MTPGASAGEPSPSTVNHQPGWTGLAADVIRRRYGQVRPVTDIIRLLDQENQP